MMISGVSVSFVGGLIQAAVGTRLAEPLGGRPAGGNWPRGRGGGFQKLVSTGGARASLEASLTMVNPANTFDYTPALIQFVLSNRLVELALVGMRIIREVESCVEI
jgi:hypothetical protein